jgi:alkanesulfonate monooxygenase SsuD/methylene tetrahydromethanopterin reductase-like flavin-dependent oxidoreductase (luciferase family)
LQQRKPNRDDFPRTDEFTESVTEVWFSGAGNSVAAHEIIHSRDQKDTFAIRKVNCLIRKYYSINIPMRFQGTKQRVMIIWRLLANHNDNWMNSHQTLQFKRNYPVVERHSARNGNEYYFYFT